MGLSTESAHNKNDRAINLVPRVFSLLFSRGGRERTLGTSAFSRGKIKPANFAFFLMLLLKKTNLRLFSSGSTLIGQQNDSITEMFKTWQSAVNLLACVAGLIREGEGDRETECLSYFPQFFGSPFPISSATHVWSIW